MKYRVDIPKPCSEKWLEMTPISAGRFCLNCKKSVIDFTTFSDRQLINFLKINKDVCGRLTTSQNNKIIQVEHSNLLSKIMFWFSSIILFLSEPLSAQSKSMNIEQTENKSNQKLDQVEQNNIISGKVLDIDDIDNSKVSSPLPAVEIVEKDTQNKVASDF